MFAEELRVLYTGIGLDVANHHGGLTFKRNVRCPASTFPLLCLPFLFVKVAAGHWLEKAAVFIKQSNSGSGIGEKEINFFQEYGQNVVKIQGRGNGLVDLVQGTDTFEIAFGLSKQPRILDGNTDDASNGLEEFHFACGKGLRLIIRDA